jgi:hypothetical protein
MSKPSEMKLTKLSAAILTLALCSAPAVAGESSRNDELPAGPMQQKAAEACATCHESRIILQQRLSKAAWTKEMDKMIKWGAVVDPKDRDAMIDYFTDFGPDLPAYAAPRTPAPSTSKTRKKTTSPTKKTSNSEN